MLVHQTKYSKTLHSLQYFTGGFIFCCCEGIEGVNLQVKLTLLHLTQRPQEKKQLG